MIYVPFVEIFPAAREALKESYSEKLADLITVIAFFAGMGLMAFSLLPF